MTLYMHVVGSADQALPVTLPLTGVINKTGKPRRSAIRGRLLFEITCREILWRISYYVITSLPDTELLKRAKGATLVKYRSLFIF